MLRMAKEDATLDIWKISRDMGISTSSAISLLASLERRGALAVTHVVTREGDGRNKDICDCLS
jgi:DNA-binding IclR family transcriptional regulator